MEWTSLFPEMVDGKSVVLKSNISLISILLKLNASNVGKGVLITGNSMNIYAILWQFYNF